MSIRYSMAKTPIKPRGCIDNLVSRVFYYVVLWPFTRKPYFRL